MRRKLLFSLIFFISSFCPAFLYAQTTIHSIDFATDGTGYTVTNGYRDSDNKYWRRFDKDDEGTGGGDDHAFQNNVTGVTGDDFYFAGEDIDTEGAITSSSINVTSYHNLDIQLKLAAPGENYDAGTDYIVIEYSFNGSTYTRLSSFTGIGTESIFREDTDNNGVGDGTQLTTALQLFTYSIPKLGNTLHVRIRANNTGSGEEFVIDNILVRGNNDATAPTITSINRTDANPTNATSVDFTVTFSEVVTGVGTGDFTKTGTANGTVNSVSGSGTVYTVTVNSVSGDGTLGVDAKTSAGGATIDDLAGNDFTAGFTTGQTYTIDNTAPAVVLSDDQTDAIVRDANTVLITATFSDVNGLSASPPTITIGSLVTGIAMSSTADPLVWTYSWDVPAGNDGAVSVSISASDAAGNANAAPTGVTSYTIDNTVPAVVLTDDHVDNFVTNGDVVNITATFTEVNNLAGTPTITIGSAVTTAAMTATADPLVWTYAWSVTTGDENASVSITAPDVAGNPCAAPTGQTSYAIDNTAPSVVLSDNHPDALIGNNDNIIITATFTESNTPLATTPAITIGTLVTGVAMTATADPLVWSYTWDVPSGNDGAISVSVATTDVVGQANTAATGQTSYTIDNIAPTVDLSDDQTDVLVRDANTVVITATFSDANSLLNGSPSLSIGSIVTSAAMIATADPLVWTYTWNVPSGNDGAVSVSISATDAAGNPNAAATGITSYTIDNTAPAVVLTDDHPDSFVKNGDVVNVTATFTEANSLSGTPDITIGSAVTNAAMTATADPLVWTYTWNVSSGNENASVSITVPDVAGNACGAPTGQTSYTIDNTAPSVVLSDNHPDALVGNNDNVIITATFTEASTPLATPAITIGTLVNGVAMMATADPLVWTYTWNVPSANDGSVSVSVSATDAAGNANTAATGQTSYTIDNIAPAVVLSDDQADVLVRDANTVLITATFSDANGLLGGTPSIAIGSVVTSTAMTATADPLVWTYSWNVPSGNNGAVSVSISAIDAASNANAAPTGTTSYTIDNVAPAVALTDDHTGNFVKNGDIVNITATFIEANGITGTPTITIGSVVTGATMSATADPLVWTYEWSVGSGNTGVAVSVAGVTDVAGNANAAATGQISYTIDNTAPTVVLTDNHADALVRDADNVVITATFTDLNGIAPSPTISIGGLITNASMSATGDPAVWTYTWNVPAGNDGPVSVSISALDVAGNSNSAATGQTTYTIDNTGAAVVLSDDQTDTFVRDADNVTITATFTEANGLAGTPAITIGAVVTNVSMSATVDPLVWTYSWNVPSGNDGNAAVSVTVNDVAGNGVSATSGRTAYTIDNTPPAVTLNDIHPDAIVRDADGFAIQALFTEANGLSGTPTISIGSVVTNIAMNATANPLDWLYNWDVPAGNDGSHAVTIAVTDVAGNQNSAPAIGTGQTTYIIDNTAPTVSSITRLDPLVNNTSTGRFQVTFDNAMAASSISIADFQAFGAASGSTNITLTATADPAVYNVNVVNISGAGNLGLRVLSANIVTDIAGNLLAAPVDGPDEYTIIFPEPTRHVTNFQVDAVTTTFTSIKLTWTDVIGSPVPSGYLIVAKRGSASPSHPVDGTPLGGAFGAQPNMIPAGNTIGYMNVAHVAGANSATFTSLLSGENYTFWIYPYTNSGSTIDYKTGNDVFTPQPLPSAGASTPVDNGVWINNRNDFDDFPEPGSVSSTATTSGTAVVNFRFQVYDHGWTSVDNASTKITQIRIQRDLVNDEIGNWFNALQSAELSDGSTTKSGTIDPIGNYIYFSGLYNGTTEFFGEVPDNGTKYYYLKVILKSSLGGSLPQDIDNKSFVFIVRNVDLTLAPNSSTLNPGNDTYPSVPTSGIGNNKVQVVATQLDFTAQPPATAFVLSNLTSPPAIKARDVNGNLDTDYTATLALTNAGNLPMRDASILPPASNAITSINMSGGAVTFPPNFQYADDGNGNGTLTATASTTAANGLIPSAAVSTAIAVSYSNTTTITPGGFGEPATFSSLLTQTTGYNLVSGAHRVFDFNVTDDGGSGGDGSPTRISMIKIFQGTGNDVSDWRQVIFDALLYDGSTLKFGTINETDITFSGINVNVNALGFVGDNATKNYQLYIRLKSTMDGTLPADIDNLNLVFRVSDDNDKITLDPLSSAFTGAEDEDSGPSNVAIDVDASRLRFIKNPLPTLLANKDISMQQTPVPQVEAVDANGNRDHDFNSITVTVTNAATPLPLSMANQPGNTSIVGGLLTFPNNFQFTSIGKNATLTVAATGPSVVTQAASSLFDVRVGVSGTITAGTAVPGTISSLDDTDPEKVKVFEFTINDDPAGTPAGEDDGNPMLVDEIKITQQAAPENTIGNWSDAIAAAILTDGSTSHTGTVGTNNITFSGIPTGTLGNITDDDSKTYQLFIYLKPSMLTSPPATIDGEKFGFKVDAIDIKTVTSGTSIKATEGLNPGAGTEVTVEATKLAFIAAAGANINVPFPVKVEARDANGNRDKDFSGTDAQITAFGTVVSVNTDVPQLNDPSHIFTSGSYTFPGNFQYTAENGTNNDGQLTMSAGKNSLATISGTSDPIDITSASESILDFNTGFTYTPRIPYISKQDDSNMQPLAGFILTDGNGTNDDIDGASTSIQSITFAITTNGNPGSSAIRNLALFDNAGTLIVSEPLSGGSITFSGLGLSDITTGPDDHDNASTTFTLRASFKDTPADVHDLDEIRVQITKVVMNGGSQLNPTGGVTGVDVNPGTGVVTAAPLTPEDVNIVNVVATQLDFTTQPGVLAGINQPIDEPVVEARDANQILDVEVDGIQPVITASTAQINAATLTPLPEFQNGVLSFSAAGLDLQYTASGNGALTVSGVPGATNAVSNTVNVRHLEATKVYDINNSKGIAVETEMLSGRQSAVILGITLTAQHTIPTGPVLNSFTINFSDDDPTTSNPDGDPLTPNPDMNEIFENVRIWQSTNDDAWTASDQNVTANFTITTSGDNIKFDLISDRNFATTTTTVTYFIMVDIKTSVNITTPRIRPNLRRLSYTGGTEGNIVLGSGSLSDGSSYANIEGRTYLFTDKAPPKIVNGGRTPANGELNHPVSGAGSDITITFDEPVETLIDKISVFRFGTQSPEITLPLKAGTVEPTNTLVFPTLGLLASDQRYYIKLDGIVDTSTPANAFAGFTTSPLYFTPDNTNWVFKTADTDGPKIVGNTVNFRDITLLGGNLKIALDEPGTVYYMIVNEADAGITQGNIIDPSTYSGEVIAGSAQISQANQDNFISIATSLADGEDYVIYVTAVDPGGNKMGTPTGPLFLSDDFDGDNPSPTHGNLIISAPVNYQICVGGYQPLSYPITISESGNGDFSNGSFNILLPAGFSFLTPSINQDEPGIVSASGSGSISATAQFKATNILQIKLTGVSGGNRESITISGLQIKAEPNATSGPIFRLGGNALSQSDIPDLSIANAFGSLQRYNVSPIDFTVTVDGAVKTSLPDYKKDANGDLQSYSAILESEEKENGTNSFSGNGVVGYTFIPSFAGIGSHVITLKYANEYGCESENALTVKVFDYSRGIDGLGTQYCTDKDVLNNIPIQGKAGYLLQGISIEKNADDDENKFDAAFDVTSALEVLDPTFTNVVFKPYVFDIPEHRALFTDEGVDYNEGGRIGSIKVKGNYLNLITFAPEPFEQVIDIYMPPRATLSFREVGPLPGSPEKYCEDQLINLEGSPRVSPSSFGEFTVNGFRGINKDGTNGYAGLTDIGDGTGILNAQDVTQANRFDALTVKYSFEIVATGCKHEVDSVINFTPKPTADFTQTAILCEDTEIPFNGQVSIYQGSSNQFGIQTLSWDFDDVNSGTDNVSAIEDPPHTFEEPGNYDVRFKAVSKDGCESAPHLAKNLIVGGKPVVNFTFSGIHNEQPIKFNASTSTVNGNSAISALEWNFGEGTSYTSISKNEVVKKDYTNPGVYQAELKVRSAIGCESTLTRTVAVVPFFRPVEGTDYFKEFTSNGEGWQALSLTNDATLNSWTFSDQQWTTGAGGSYKPQERSALYTAALDLSGITRPILSFTNVSALASSDGVVLEYSTDTLNVADPDKHWETLGTLIKGIVSGANWYNGVNLASQPGEQITGDLGWTGNLPERESKHSLSALKGQPNVVFRFALASALNTQPNLEGFSVDNFRIGNGTRTVLIENFTNTGSTDPSVRAENDSLKNFDDGEIGVELVKLNYHVGFPGQDPFNLENQADPGARALYYGISTVNQVRLDGINYSSQTTPKFSQWGPGAFSNRILDLANASIDVTAKVVDGELVISGTFTPSVTMANPAVLHVAVVEEHVTVDNNPNLNSGGRIRSGESEFEYVVRKMLPNAAGTKFTTTLTAGAPVSFGPFTWANVTLFKPEDDLAVIVFLQDEDSKVVYQSYVKRNIEDPGIVTGIEDLNASFNVYPNPADREMTIELPAAATQRTTLRMYDQLGKVVEESYFEKGESKKTVTTEDLAGGVYLIQVESPKGMLRRKVMVAHRN